MDGWVGGGGGSGRLPIHSVKPKLVLGLCGSCYRLQESPRWSAFSIRWGFKSDKYLAKGESVKEIFPLYFLPTSFLLSFPPFSLFLSC